MSLKEAFPFVYKQYRELVLLCLGFLLTGIIGTAITSYYQRRQLYAERKAEQLRIDKETAMSTASEIQDLLGKHHFAALQLRGAIDTYLSSPTPENLRYLQDQSGIYRTTLKEWNTNWNKNRSRLRIHFGSDIEGTFYTHDEIDKEQYAHSITGLFNTMHNELVAAKETALSSGQKSYDFSLFDDSYHAVGYLSYEISNAMMSQIQSGQIGSFQKKPLKDLAPTYAFKKKQN